MAYASVAQVVEWLDLSESLGQSDLAERQTLITRLLEAATSQIDQVCERSFEQVSEARTFHLPWAQPTVDIGDCQSVSAVSEDGEALAQEGWRLRAPTVRGRPSQFLDRLPAAGSAVRFDRGGSYYGRGWDDATQTAGWLSPVEVTGVWGWAAPPDAVVQACVMMASRLHQRTHTPTGSATFGEGGVFFVRNTDPDIQALLEPYRLPGAGGL